MASVQREKKKLARIQLSRLVNNVFIIYSKYMSVSTVFISGEDGRVGGGGGLTVVRNKLFYTVPVNRSSKNSLTICR